MQRIFHISDTVTTNVDLNCTTS